MFAPDGVCVEMLDPFSGCVVEAELATDLDPGDFSFVWSVCHTPTVTSISPRELNVTDDIMITGSGFAAEACRATVMFGKDSSLKIIFLYSSIRFYPSMISCLILNL